MVYSRQPRSFQGVDSHGRLDGWIEGQQNGFKRHFISSQLYLDTVRSHCPTGFKGSFILPLLYVIHLESNGFFSIFLNNFEPNYNFELSTNSFKLTLQFIPHLSIIKKLGWFLNTFEIVFTLKILQANSHNCFILFSYRTRSHSTLNCACLWGSPLPNLDQVLRWSSSHNCSENIILTHEVYFMPLILKCLCNTFFPISFWNSNQRWTWNNNSWH
jgi:hypothetical protein